MQNASPAITALNDPAANDQSLAQVLLQSAAKILRPLVRLWITHGVTYQMASELLKRVYVETAREHFVEQDASGTRLSLLTGINRKEIKRLTQVDEAQVREDGVDSFAAAIYAKWRNSKQFLDNESNPRELLRRTNGDELSFDDLVRSVTTDHRPSAVLHELSRLGYIEVIPATDERGDLIRLKQDTFLPRKNICDRLLPFTQVLQDHGAAAVNNILANKPVFLDRFVSADELSADSAQALQLRARELWLTVQDDLAMRAIDCEAQDAAAHKVLKSRIRIGMYCYSETEGTS